MQELEEYRQQIRKINTELLHLLKKRLDVVKKIGELKKREGIPIRDIKTEDRQVQELTAYGKELELDGDFVEDIFRRIIAYAVEFQKKMENRL